MSVKIGIVGAEKWTEKQKMKVKDEIKSILLGHCKLLKDKTGVMPDKVDISTVVLVSAHDFIGQHAQEVADGLGIKKEIYPAENKGWNDKSYCGFYKDCLHFKEEHYSCHTASPDKLNCVPYEIRGHKEGRNPELIKLKGFRSRNIQVATAERKGEKYVLYCVVPRTYILTKEEIQQGILADYDESIYCKHCNKLGHPSNGGCWTMRYAKKLGKEVHLIVIE